MALTKASMVVCVAKSYGMPGLSTLHYLSTFSSLQRCTLEAVVAMGTQIPEQVSSLALPLDSGKEDADDIREAMHSKSVAILMYLPNEYEK